MRPQTSAFPPCHRAGRGWRQQVGLLLILFCPPAFAEHKLWFPFRPTPWLARPGDTTVAAPLRLLQTRARAASRAQSQEPPGHRRTTMCTRPWGSASSSVASGPCGWLFAVPPHRARPAHAAAGWPRPSAPALGRGMLTAGTSGPAQAMFAGQEQAQPGFAWHRCSHPLPLCARRIVGPGQGTSRPARA